MISPRCGLANSLRSEALQKQNAWRRQHIRAATEDRSQDANAIVGGHRESTTPRPSRLQRNLVGLRVVVVDDDDSSLDYFAMALRTCGAVVLTASTAKDALRLVQEQRPDVVLSDIAMRGDGYWLVREIRGLADQAASLAPVVATTAFGREHSRAGALAAGFNEFLAKPVDPEILCRTIANMAGR
jgi:CheY-like chemotaxis protein